VPENHVQVNLMAADAAGHTSPYDFGKHSGKHPEKFLEMTAWADMLSRIGQKNVRLHEFVAQDPSLWPTIEARGRRTGPSIMQELERERSRIARELHAGAGQPLSGIKINLEILDNCAGDLPPSGRAALGRLQSLTEQALQQVRAVSHNLHPPDWQGLSTEAALHQLVRDSGLAGRLAIDLDIQPLPQEPVQAVKIAIYRCTQECLSNVARHSDATELQVSLHPDGRMIELRLRDNGRGIPQDQPAGPGIGLTAIREHATALDGTCSISSGGASGIMGGVMIIVRLPLDPD
jgi:two-component system NarL family sensor kinase